MIVYALFGVTLHRKDLIAVFAHRAAAVEFAEITKVASWHIQEVPFTASKSSK